MLKSLKYYFFKKRRNKFIEDMYETVDPWSAVLVKDIISGFLIAHTQGKYKRALDIGCGEGVLTSTLRDISESYVGVDVSAKALERAKEANKSLSEVEFKQMDFDRLANLQGKFDLLCFSFSLDYLGFQKHPKKFAKSLYDFLSARTEAQCDVFIFNPVYAEKNLEDLQKYFFMFKNFGFHLKRNELLPADGFKLACIHLIKR
jgi:ubiquinone/menaquinone biosynthesis C-methylase UbiE